MSLNNTPAAERIHIGLFGRRNAGKSSLMNAVTGQDISIITDTPGTTTDPVSKAMELLPLGPVVMIDTPGMDDVGDLGTLRVQKSYQALNKTDLALLVIDASSGMTEEDLLILESIRQKKIPYLLVLNKADLEVCPKLQMQLEEKHLTKDDVIEVSALTGKNIEELKNRLAHLVPQEEKKRKIVGDLVEAGDFVLLVVPIDASAPKGRLILPQQQTIRDLLDSNATAVVVKDTELKETLEKLGVRPKLVITDSQVFAKVSALVPNDIPLTSFSILFARYKGNLDVTAGGVKKLDHLEEDDKILISEGCTHHRQCEDIGTVKIPRMVSSYCGKKLQFEFTSGGEFPADLSSYAMIIHCGGCTLNEREMKYRLRCAEEQNIPITNYGMAIAYMHGILKRSMELFEEDRK